jgi:hypothetical protein
MKCFAVAASLFAVSVANAAADGVSVGEGQRVAMVGGCHDCHTDGYAVSGGQIDPENALLGSAVGFQGPWGTTYPSNLRLTLAKMSEDEFVDYGHAFKTRPPMPWFNVHAMKGRGTALLLPLRKVAWRAGHAGTAICRARRPADHAIHRLRAADADAIAMK